MTGRWGVRALTCETCEINLLSQAHNPSSLSTMSLHSATQAKISAEDNLIIAGDYDTNDNSRQEE